MGPTASDAQVALKASQLGLDRPLVVQYWDWLTGALTGDLGRSWFTGQLVSVGVSSRLSVTISLVLGAVVIAAVISVVIGVWAAVRRGWVDRVVQFVGVLGFAIPGFLIALGLVTLFAMNLSGSRPPVMSRLRRRSAAGRRRSPCRSSRFPSAALPRWSSRSAAR